jgi:Leucine-rich repeat (LRR) protein
MTDHAKPKIKKLTKEKVQEMLQQQGGTSSLPSSDLDLTGRGIETVERDAWDDWTRKKLDLSHNKITRLSFPGPMRALTQLKIASNLLTEGGVVDMIRHCKTLISLDLSDNKLTRLPTQSLRQCTQLKALVLTRNALTSLEWLPPLPQLTSLIVSHNRITNIAANTLGRVKHLVKFSMYEYEYI